LAKYRNIVLTEYVSLSILPLVVTIEAYRTPGQLVQGLLDSKGWTQMVLAMVLGVDKGIINKIVADKRPIDAEMALTLAETFGIPAEKFLEIQKSYDLATARITTRPDPRRATRAKVFGEFPFSEMIKRGWLEGITDIRNVPALEAALAKFCGEKTIDEIEILPHAAKKTPTFMQVTPAQLAWLYRVKAIASDMLVPRYSDVAARQATNSLSKLLLAPEEARKVPRILAECGIRYVIVETLSSARIDGVCLWLDEHSPVIGMTLRHDRIDNFWFVLRHELEHVLRHHGQGAVMLDAELEGKRAGTGSDIAEEERIANKAAANFCVPTNTMDSFVARKAPLFSERDVIGVARTLNIHPGLVAGQLQHRTERYNIFRHHLVKIRSAVLPSAMVDGWGNIAPVDV
jgi:HTH-type transcriptional regulator/antitoxin HigA